MKKLVLMVTAVALLVGGVVTPALAGRYYVGGNVGMVFVDDSDLSVDGNGNFGSLSHDTGYGADVVLGNSLGDGLRSELEVFYRVNDLDEVSGNVGEVSLDKVTSWGTMANFYFDFENQSAFTPFIGAGIGVANVDLDIEEYGGDEWVFAYQGMAGCSYSVNKELSLDLQYRYFATDEPEFEVQNVNYDYEYRTHNVMFGIRYYF